MANKAKTMLQIRRLLQLLISVLSEWQIANTIGMSHNTIAIYLKRFKSSGSDFSQLLSHSDEALGSIVYNHSVETRKDERYGRLSPKLSLKKNKAPLSSLVITFLSIRINLILFLTVILHLVI